MRHLINIPILIAASLGYFAYIITCTVQDRMTKRRRYTTARERMR